MAVLLRDHLSLLGDLEVAGDGPVGLSQDGGVGRTTPTTDGASPAVEKPEMDPLSLGYVSHRPLRLVDLPLASGDAPFLVRVGVPENHLLAVAAEGQYLPVLRVGE